VLGLCEIFVARTSRLFGSMDGMLFVAFFFPLVLCLGVVFSFVGFLLALWAGFGAPIGDFVGEKLQYVAVPEWVSSLIVTVLKNPPFKAVGWFVYPLLLNSICLATVFGTYSLGNVLYRSRGWKFNQPMKGGLRFVLLQSMLWSTVAVALVLPWLSLESIGLLNHFGLVPESKKDNSNSFGGLLVCGAALGMLSESLVIVGLMAFDDGSNKLSRDAFRTLETGNWNWNKMFGESSHTFWWMFILVQCSMVLYAGALAFLADEVKNNVIQTMMLMVFVALLAVALALTNAVGGKWRHGEDNFHIIMPGRGGPIFMLFQGLGWTSFAAVLLVVISKLFGITKDQYLSLSEENLFVSTLFGKGIMVTAGVLAIFSELFIAASLLLFDPNKAGDSSLLQTLDRHDHSKKKKKAKEKAGRKAKRTTKADKKEETELWEIERIIGKRPVRNDSSGSFEFLVQWHQPAGKVTWVLSGALFSRVERKRVDEAISAYETHSAQYGNISDDETSTEVRRSRKTARRRHRGRSKTPKPGSRKNEEKAYEWEECEDEMGNVFYYCLTTGETAQTLEA